jgi:hypothetical protein
MKTLSRKSIKPVRLFETEEDKAIREAREREEALTDVDESSSEQLLTGDKVVNETKPTRKIKSSSNLGEKKTSPFDKWPRLKKSSRDNSGSKPGKRMVDQAADDTPAPASDQLNKSNKRKARA